MKRTALTDSENIKSVGYENGKLQVEFTTGSLYEYQGVPQDVYEEFMKTDKHGRFGYDHIFYTYHYLKLR